MTGGEAVSPEDDWIAGCPRCRVHMLGMAADAGFTPRLSYETEDYVAQLGLVGAGLGVALIPDLALVTVRDDVVIRELTDEDHHRVIEAATLDGAYCSPAAQLMLDLLAEVSAGFAETDASGAGFRWSSGAMTIGLTAIAAAPASATPVVTYGRSANCIVGPLRLGMEMTTDEVPEAAEEQTRSGEIFWVWKSMH